MFKKNVAIGALFLATFFVACSEDSSSSPTSSQLPPYSSANTEEFYSSSSMETPDSPLPMSSAAIEEPSQTDSTPNAPDVSLNIVPDADGFYKISDVYSILEDSDKAAFLVRHAERIDDLGQEAPLTDDGVAQSIKVGESLASDEPFYYASSGFVRTTKTCEYVAQGRGEAGASVEAWNGLNGNYFVLDTALFNKYSKLRGGAWKVLAKWAYTGTTPDALYDLNERGAQYINEVILPAMDTWEERVGFLSSHDVLLMPMTVYASKGAVDLKFHENGRWINYLTGIAIIKKSSGEVVLLPIKAMDTGIMGVDG